MQAKPKFLHFEDALLLYELFFQGTGDNGNTDVSAITVLQSVSFRDPISFQKFGKYEYTADKS